MGRKEERLKYEGVNNQGSKFRVVEYRNNKYVVVEFYDYHGENEWRRSRKKTVWHTVESGQVHDNYFPTIEGVGCVGNNNSTDQKERAKLYDYWYGMMRRSYNKAYHDKKATYENCSVYREWNCFEYFERDYKELLKENNFPKESRICLDKDIIHKGNKIYSKENCVIVDQRINSLFTKCDKLRGDLPIGVYYNKKCVANPYLANLGIMENGKRKTIYLGGFKTPELAFNAYKIAKENYIKQVADEYVELGYITKDSRLYKAMYDWVVEITD